LERLAEVMMMTWTDHFLGHELRQSGVGQNGVAEEYPVGGDPAMVVTQSEEM
jgi:hypothetical protein